MISANANSTDKNPTWTPRMLAAIAKNAKTRQKGACWTVAEHRVRPKLLSTQTGYMQGAAGIGLLFLHDAARRKGKPRRIVLPDSPYPRKQAR